MATTKQPKRKTPARVTVFCTYHPNPGKERALLSVLKRHWTALAAAGLVSGAPAKIYRARSRQTPPYFVEIFQWKNEAASELAHNTPSVLAVWRRIGELAGAMSFAHVEPIE